MTFRPVSCAVPSPVVMALAALLCAGCEALVPSHHHSLQVDVEHATIVVEAADAAAPPLRVVLPRDASQPSLRVDPMLLQQRLNDLVAHTALTAPRPPSMWGARTAAEFFGEAPRLVDAGARGSHGALLELRPGVRGFRLERWLRDQRAAVLEFSLEPRGEAFRVVLDRITMDDCRAKVADASWRNWWSRIPLGYGFVFDVMELFGDGYGDDALDMQVDVAFTATWSDASGESHTAPLAVMGWTVLDVPLHAGPLELGQAGGWLPIVPPSASLGSADGAEFGRGLFVVEAFVTEQDELAPAYLSDHDNLSEYFDDLLGLVPMPAAPIP